MGMKVPSPLVSSHSTPVPSLREAPSSGSEIMVPVLELLLTMAV